MNSGFPPKRVWTVWCQLCSGDLCPAGGCSHGLLTPLDINAWGRDTSPLLGQTSGHQCALGVQQKEHQWAGNPGAFAQQKHFHKLSCSWEMSPYSHAQPGFLWHVLEAASSHPSVSFLMSTFDMLSWTFIFPALVLNSFWFFCLETSFLLPLQLYRLQGIVALL